MQEQLRHALVALDHQAIRAGRPDLVMQVQTIWWSLEQVCRELERLPTDRPQQ